MVRLGTRLGTQLGTYLGAGSAAAQRVLYALSSFSAANYFATQVGGGEVGSTTGFAVAMLFRYDVHMPFTGTGADILTNVTSGGGWYWGQYQTAFAFSASNAVGGYVGAANWSFTPSDVGRLFACVAYARVGTGVYGSTNRQPVVTSALPGYLAASVPMTLGRRPGATPLPAPHVSVIGWETFRITTPPSADDMLAYLDAMRASGEMPGRLAGVNAGHRWPDRALLRSLTAPASIPDVVTGAAVDAMARQGSPSVVAIDTSRDGCRTLGAQGFSAANRFESAAGAGIRGAASGFHVRVPVTLYSTTGTEYLACCSNTSGTVGWAVTRTGAAVRLDVGNGTVGSAQRALTTADLAVPHLIELVYDGTNVRLRWDGGEVASVAATFAEAAAAIPMTIGALSSGAGPAATSSVWAVAGAHTVPSQADSLAAYQTWLATGALPRVSHPTAHHYELTEDILVAGETIPAQILDRIGTDHLTRVGTLQLAQRTERVWSYETQPIMHGAQDMSDAHHYTIADGPFRGDVAGHFVGLLFRVNAQTGAGARVLTCQSTANTGWEMRTTGTNSTIFPIVLNAAGSTVSGPVQTIAAADVGKLLLYLWAFDPTQGRIRAWWKRAELTAQTIVGYSPTPANTPLMVGRNNLIYPGSGTAGVSVFGLVYGLGVLAPAEAYAHHDAVQAQERMVPMPGRASTVITFDAQGNATGMTRVGSPTLSTMHSRAFAW